MLKRVESEHVDQTRWNDVIGREALAAVDATPERFVVDLADFSPRVVDLLDRLGDLEGVRVLEYGSGRGELSVAMAQRGAGVTGLEIGPELVTLATRVADLNEVECRFRQGSIIEVPFGEASFDVVVGNAILHHLPRQGVAAAVAEAHRVLAPGGRAYFVEPMENSRTFDFLQNLVPVGSPAEPLSYRPSLLNRAAWRTYLNTVEDRTLTEREMVAAGRSFASIDVDYDGMLSRLCRLVPGAAARRAFAAADRILTHRSSPVRRFGQVGVITYRKEGRPRRRPADSGL